jgi:hypothetical protein
MNFPSEIDNHVTTDERLKLLRTGRNVLDMQKLFKKVMQRSNRRWAVGFSVAALLVCASFGQVSTGKVENKNQTSKQSQDRATLAHVQAGLLGQPLAFEANRGQVDANVKFLTRAQNFTVFMTPGETVLRGRNADVLRIKLLNANQSPKLVGESRQARISNYYIGNDRSKWLTGVPNYGQVRYQEVYSGIDMVYHSDQRQLEYDFVVKPGADPNQIRVAFDGPSKMSITKQGELEMQSAAGDSVNHKPVVYQMVGSHRKMVDGEFALANNTVSFKVGEYDRTQPLVIDPSLQVLSFFGGTLNDEAAGIAVSAVQASSTVAGVVFVGRSESPSLPGAVKPAGTINWDSFAVGLNGGTVGVPAAGGTAVLWTTYFGGSSDDAARGVAMDNQGNVYITGYTSSSNFPMGGVPASYDAYLVKLGASGGGLAAGVLYGGNLVDQATSIALDYSTFSTAANAPAITNPATDPRVTPNVVIGGFTSGGIGQPGSTTSMVGKTPDGKQTSFANCTAGTAGCGNTDGFVATFTSALALLHHTYIGGGGNDQVNGVAADIWGNIYATGFATPAVAPNFLVVNGIAQTTAKPNWDAATNAPLNAAVAFVAKWACTTGTPAIGVPSPPFGGTPNSQMPICGGTNNLKTLSNSALFGGSAAGGTFINPQQTVLGQNGITEAGLAIAVDQNGWGQEGVAGVARSGFFNAAGFPDIVPLAAGRAVSSTNSATVGGFEPGLSGPHVYIVGTTASRNFVNSLVLNASCTTQPTLGSGTVPGPLCPTPEVFGAAVPAAGALPGRSFCDPLLDLGLNNCPTNIGTQTTDLRIKTVLGGGNSGQTQGWLASFQFPAVTQAVVTPPSTPTVTASTNTVTTLNPPTIPNYILLQPATCPSTGGGAAACVEGGGSVNSAVFAGATPPAANFGCTTAGGVSCPTAFIGSWNAVAVDTEQQVYVIGQMGMSGTTSAVFGTGAPNRLALEIERISPYANTGPNGAFVQPNFCPGLTDAPCAFPLEQFPSSLNFGTDFLVDTATMPTGANGSESSFGQILPGAPPFPNPNQIGGVGSGIAVNPAREAYFVGTTTVTSPAGSTTSSASFTWSPIITFAPNGTPATATASVTAGAVTITLTNGGSGYLTPPTVTLNGVSGCTTNPGPYTATLTGGVVTAITPVTSGGGCIAITPTVTISVPPVSSSGTPPSFQGGLGATGATNAGATGTEDVVYGAIQFFDAIASPTVVNFTATVNDATSITAPNGLTGVNAKAVINYSNWESQVLNIPPGCIITPNVPNGPGGVPAFIVQQINGTSSFLVTVNSTAAALGPVAFPGVVTSLVTFTKTGTCTGVGQPFLESWDPLTLTLTVSAPLNLIPENTFQITSVAASGILQPYFNNGFQLAANQSVVSSVDVSTATAAGPINFTAQIVPGVNWITGLVSVATPTDTIYPAVGAGTPTRIPVTVNAALIAGLPPGTYTASLLFAASPETPALPTAGSFNCGIVPGVPVASGTTSPACVPIVITITGGPIASPVTIVFQNSTAPRQSGLQISNPIGTAGPYNFTAGYQPSPVYGTALPAANVFFVGTGTTLIPATVGNSVGGTIAPGGIFTVPIQVDPTGLPTGVYSGQLLVSNNGTLTGATPQTTVPIIVYVGPKPGDDLPTGSGLGLMLPVNLPPIGGGLLPGTAQTAPLANPSAGAYPLLLSVPAGYGPTGPNQIANPTLIQVTGLNNISTTPFSVGAPSVSSSLVGVSITDPGGAFGSGGSSCSTYSQTSVVPGTPLGPVCAWSIWVDSTSLNSSNTQQLAACGTAPDNFGETGTLTFKGSNFASLVVPVTVCVTDAPRLTVAMPTTFPNPTFGTGLPQNAVPGFAQSVVEMSLPSTGVTLLAQAGNSSQVCKVLDIHTNGGVVPNVTIAEPGVQWVTVQPPTPLFAGALPAFTNPFTVTPLAPINGAFAQFAAGPLTLGPGLVTFQLCVNTDPLGNTAGTFSTTVTINGAGVGAINIPVNIVINQAGGGTGGGGGTGTPDVFSQIGIFRPPVPVGGALGFFTLDSNGNNAFDVTDKTRQFGLAGDYPVAGDWDGNGTIKLGVFRCPAPGAGVCTWYLDENNNGVWDGTFNGDIAFQFGLPGDIPVVGDWTGTGVSKVGVMRCPAVGQPGVCTWILDTQNLRAPGGNFLVSSYGVAGDQPAVGNWAGAGGSKPIDNIGVFRSGQWILNSSGSGFWTPTDTQYSYGLPGDVPVTGNWLGAASKRIGVFRCPAGAPGSALCQWILNTNGSGAFSATDLITSYGLVGDKPVVGFWTVQ